jgi:plastocyanin
VGCGIRGTARTSGQVGFHNAVEPSRERCRAGGGVTWTNTAVAGHLRVATKARIREGAVLPAVGTSEEEDGGVVGGGSQ